MSKIIDISMPLSNQTPAWPGDTPFHYEVSWTKEESGSVNVGKVETSTHVGTHIDAPFHFDNDGKKVDELSLDRYISKAVVVDCLNKSKIQASDVIPFLHEGVTSVLFKTTYWKDRQEFPKSIPTMDRELPKILADKGILLIGVDLPSVDPINSKELDIHHELLEHDILILEGIVLDHVDTGLYELISLPLKLEGADGSPVRAVLKKE
ncbi:arylformamidase [Jeotgalibacillus sp. S-D1]|uniref:arylformamidase n=1 Tax=Jeotgalibacillus sp. S-D1 TaxID=2552189 RepID=UPI00105A3FB6|nr:arylformamidase [Jeotgalibacillus sp. S-D1]TDL35420.1 arylformamidase [Jeotgalibacillus sp. S-D1]